MTDFRATRPLIAALEKAGLQVAVERSRQSRSTYLTVELSDEAAERFEEADPRLYLSVTVRVSDHRSPALRVDRVRSEGDRADLTDYEWRADQGRAYQRRSLAPVEYLGDDWRHLVSAVCARFGVAA